MSALFSCPLIGGGHCASATRFTAGGAGHRKVRQSFGW
jgi:hypothetical protein